VNAHTNLGRAFRLAASSAAEADPDALMQTWHDARQDSAEAYAAWQRCMGADRATAYTVYVAAGDREAAAESLCLGALQYRETGWGRW
jgi:hypothetical protein